MAARVISRQMWTGILLNFIKNEIKKYINLEKRTRYARQCFGMVGRGSG